MLDLEQWAFVKAASFNRKLAALSQGRIELLFCAHRLLCGVARALEAADMQESPENFRAKELLQTVEEASSQDKSKGDIWVVNKQQLV